MRFPAPITSLFRRPSPLPSGLRFDAIAAVLSAWLVAGAYLDGWAHNHLEAALETFFTPWHAVLYSGFAALAAFYVWSAFGGGLKGWRGRVPEGYMPALTGVLVFFAGGVGDGLWHVLLGVENGIEALLSPTHLLLAVGAMLMASGPWLAAWKRKGEPHGAGWIPVVLSLTFTLSVLTFMTEFSHPIAYGAVEAARPRDALFARQSASVGGFLLYAAFLSGLGLLAAKRWRLPFGTFTAIVGLNSAAMSVLDDKYLFITGALAAGLVADLLVRAARDAGDRDPDLTLRLLGFVLPAAFTLTYFLLTFLFCEGVWWSVHVWAGTPVMAGLVGLMASLLVAPPER